ncbi:DNA-binding transcriptional activator of the SARP family [Amycolatopsis pretoriensis]|uniref:DNA-binding transcriptional activator of the SARP family n=1 Tax=Amycolatopsis pretoriensis TaxID=218821 RepID=A0A1H5QPH4_9PSEU|nr:BTAD domain-containing putative transcriptional regulator [Amycolatopsis pretoriensis]SEF27744.1 DNA-binding transcriptional activator of the SARP family [Amycolatopsis pretoriensis]
MTDSGTGLRIQVLGPLRVWRGETELKAGPTRQRTVLAVLASRAGHPVTRTELVSALWGGQPPVTADGSIHTYVSGLRRALEPGRGRGEASGVLSSGPVGYTLLVEPTAIDALTFERLIARAQKEQPDTAMASLDEALAQWRGEPLSGLPGPFAEDERTRLDRLRLTALERRAEAMLAMGEHTEVIAELATLTAEFPLHEGFREMQMIALHRSGQHHEALAVFREVRATLVAELGVEPGAALQQLHARLLARDPGLDYRPTGPQPALLSVLPTQFARRFETGAHPAFVGRTAELERLRELIDQVCDGRGGSAWLEGVPGIGKTELLARALADVADRGCQIGWATAAELSSRIPLEVVFTCVGMGGNPGGSWPADRSDNEARTSIWGDRDPAAASVSRLLELVDELCGRAPLILVIDDVQWADEASVLLWQRLTAATRQSPLLLIAAARPVPRPPHLARLRRAIEDRNGEIINVGLLSTAEAVELQENLVGAKVGPRLRELVAHAAGNPLYLAELTGTMLREHAVTTIDGVADLEESVAYNAPYSLMDMIGRHLGALSAETSETLRWASVLGTEFTATDVAAVTGRSPRDLLAIFEEGLAASQIVDAGTHLAFQHPLFRQAFYDSIPPEARAARHRWAAEAIAGAGAPVSRIAEQMAATDVAGPWVMGWLAENHDALSNRAPLIAVDLLLRAFDVCPAEDPRREDIAAALVKVQFRLGQRPEELARLLSSTAVDPARAAEMRQLLAAMRYRRGDLAGAVEALSAAVDDPRVPELWRRRHRHLLANFRRGDLADLDHVEAAGQKAVADADGDEYLTAHALQTLWLTSSVKRDHEVALDHVDNAITVLSDVDSLVDLKLDLLDNRVFTLQNLDRLAEAGGSLNTARRIADVHGLTNHLQVSAAVHGYWMGKWDDALVEVDLVAEDGPAITFFGLREPPAAALLLHGVAALICGQRGDTIRAAAELEAIDDYPSTTQAEREAVDFLLFAQSLSFLQHGDTGRALEVLDPILNPEFSPMMLRHQWLPSIVQLALEAGDSDRAMRAVRICDEEAAKERVAARAAMAADWCHGLVERDPGPVLSAATHYRRVGRLVELGKALEDASMLLAGLDRDEEARTAFEEMIAVYTELSADWNLRRAEARFLGCGATERLSADLVTPKSNGKTLSTLEVKIARLVAEGHSNATIADRVGLSRRLVQAHVTRVLDKLGAVSRDGIPKELQRPSW